MTQSVYSAENYNTQLTQFIKKNIVYYETNPIHKFDNDSVNSLFSLALKNEGNLTTLRYKLFESLYANSSSLYEDSSDFRRLKTRRALLFAAIALTADDESYSTFLDYAKYSLKDGSKIEEHLEPQYCALLFLEILINRLQGIKKYKGQFDELESFLENQKSNLPEDVYLEAKRLIENK